MPAFKCRMCGGIMEVPEGDPTAKCIHCGTVQAVIWEAQTQAAQDDAAAGRSVHIEMSMGMKLITVIASIFIAVALVWFRTQIPKRHETVVTIDTAATDIVQNELDANGPYSDGDNAETVGWYLEAALHGDVGAQYGLGEMYYNGQGVERDVSEAVKWYKMAAEHEHTGAQNKLGNAYYNGWGVEKNYKEAARWYRRAALRGNAEAQTSLGNMFYNGTGVGKNYSNAVWWYNMAAGQGHAWAQYYLGNMYRNGLGVPKDLKRARALYQAAISQGHLGALGAYEHIKNLE